MYTNFTKICASLIAAGGGMISLMLLDRAESGPNPWVIVPPAAVLALSVWGSIRLHEEVAIDEEIDRDLHAMSHPRLRREEIDRDLHAMRYPRLRREEIDRDLHAMSYPRLHREEIDRDLLAVSYPRLHRIDVEV